MSNRLLIVGIALASLALPISLKADVAAGKTAFDKACKSCHGADGKGNPVIAKMTKVEMRALGSSEVQAKNDAAISKDITEGMGKMKGVKSLAAPDVKSVVEFVRTLKN